MQGLIYTVIRIALFGRILPYTSNFRQMIFLILYECDKKRKNVMLYQIAYYSTFLL